MELSKPPADRPSRISEIKSRLQSLFQSSRQRILSYWKSLPTQFKHSFLGALLAGALIAVVLYFVLCEFILVTLAKVAALILLRE